MNNFNRAVVASTVYKGSFLLTTGKGILTSTDTDYRTLEH